MGMQRTGDRFTEKTDYMTVCRSVFTYEHDQSFSELIYNLLTATCWKSEWGKVDSDDDSLKILLSPQESAIHNG
jgi:hypothetical protein